MALVDATRQTSRRTGECRVHHSIEIRSHGDRATAGATRDLVSRPLDIDYVPTGWYAEAMSPQPVERLPSGGARGKLLDAAFSIIREKGYAATSVDELCAQAGVTKGAFFHHFKSKDALGVAAAHHWSETTGAFFETAPYHKHTDPLERVLGYLDFRKAMLTGEIAEFTCLVGTMVQEIYDTHPDIREACEACIRTHAAKVESDIADAMKLYRIRAPWTAEGLALHMQVVLQGAFILAKAKGNAAVVEASIDHLRRYVELLFGRPSKRARRKN
jgi:TetR/AcrR family transcriptional repressor of nem operon